VEGFLKLLHSSFVDFVR